MDEAPKPRKVGLGTKLAIVAALSGIGLSWLFLGSPIQWYRDSEERVCRTQCDKVNKFSRLVSQNPVGSLTRGRYDGPWRCECY
jgi:hypothetical protein